MAIRIELANLADPQPLRLVTDPRAAFGLLDTVERSVTLTRVPYDIATAQAKIIRAGLPDVLAAQGDTVRVLHTLTPIVVLMAGEDEHEPYKD